MEFGSDFHKVKNYQKGQSILDIIGDCQLYYDGRQSLESVLLHENIKRVWIPSYYCHEAIKGVVKLGIKIQFYPCTPFSNQEEAISNIPTQYGDALVRMNYFGLQQKPRTLVSNLLLIEDHSHNPISNWALNSDADWCVASLRKTLPISDGGILWSPKGKQIPSQPQYSQLALHNTFRRNAAMELKSEYLEGNLNSKEFFLSELRMTEENFGYIPIAPISDVAKEIVKSLDIVKWFEIKKTNWYKLREYFSENDSFKVMLPETEDEIPFSLVLLFNKQEERDRARHGLITNEVYPAILWNIPDDSHPEAIDISNRILSIHCDARYTLKDMSKLANKIKSL